MPTPEFDIRPGTSADVPVILALIRGLAEYEKLSHAVVATEASLRETLFGPRPFAEVLIARVTNEPAGFALFFHNYSTFLGQPGLYLEDIFVRPEFRRQGIGLALLKQIAQIAAERNCGRIDWSVLEWNQPAIEFYKSIGAKMLDDWRVMRMDREAIEKLAQGSGS